MLEQDSIGPYNKDYHDKIMRSLERDNETMSGEIKLQEHSGKTIEAMMNMEHLQETHQ